MSNKSYTLKLSSQGQLTIPRRLREELGLQPGSHVGVTMADDGGLALSGTPAIAARFGTLDGAWTNDGQDATEYTRALRDEMQPKSTQR